MKKIFTAPSMSFMEVEMESAILGASNIVTGQNAAKGSEGGVSGPGDGLARQNGNTPNGNNQINAQLLDF